MMRTIPFLMLLLFACNAPDAENTTTTEHAVTEADPEADPVETITRQYEQVLAEMERGTLRVDSVLYECENEPESGMVKRHYRGDEQVLVQWSRGSEHSWSDRQVFLDGGEPYFVLEELGSWSFGGPATKDETGTNTIDQIREVRYYLQDGKIVQHLNKGYEIKSWEPEPDPAQIPSTPLEHRLGQEYAQPELMRIISGTLPEC